MIYAQSHGFLTCLSRSYNISVGMEFGEVQVAFVI